MKSSAWVLTFFVLMVFLVKMFSPSVYADRGGFSVEAGRVSETGQRAIIAWNGTFEVLSLSTDISSTQESEVVEIMPLPSSPSISAGSTGSFLKVQELVNTYFALIFAQGLGSFGFMHSAWQSQSRGGQGEPQVTIVFQQEIGLHFLTVVKAVEAVELSEWLTGFLQSRGYPLSLPADLQVLLQNYTRNDMHFFVIDMIAANSTVRTVEPLVYRFNTSKLYYPLSISNLFSGESEISVFTVTSSELKEDAVLGGKFSRNAQFQIRKDAVSEISPNMTDLFSGDPYLCYFSFRGSLAELKEDLLAEFLKGPDIPTVALTALSLSWGAMLVFASLAWRKFPLHTRIARKGWLTLFLLLTAGIGAVLMCAGLFLPWGLSEFGNVLVPVTATYATAQLGGFGQLFFMVVPPTLLLCVFYFQSVTGNSARTSMATIAVGTLATAVVLASFTRLYSLESGAFITLTGYIFIIAAGYLSFLKTGREPVEPSTNERRGRMTTYVARRVSIAVMTLIGISWVIFLIIYSLPWDYIIREFFLALSFL
jgi:hypothetical protein